MRTDEEAPRELDFALLEGEEADLLEERVSQSSRIELSEVNRSIWLRLEAGNLLLGRDDDTAATAPRRSLISFSSLSLSLSLALDPQTTHIWTYLPLYTPTNLVNFSKSSKKHLRGNH